MVGLRKRVRTNLRTMLMTWLWFALVFAELSAQNAAPCSVTGCDVLSESEGISSPLAPIGGMIDMVFAPRPFGLDGLSQARIAVPVEQHSMSVAFDARGSLTLRRYAPSARIRWSPMESYVMGLAGTLEWLSIRGFDDVISAVIDAHAGMSMAEWTMCVGIDALVEIGAVRGPTFRAGMSRSLDSHSVMADVRIPWDRSASLRLAALFHPAERVRMRVGLASNPTTIECAVRLGVSPTADLMVDIRHVQPLGMRTALTLSVDVP
ncbi:MAG: hypothetical protein RIR53_1366 [Bacteroidota bacterium]